MIIEPFEHGDMEGNLPGTGRRWEIADEIPAGFEVWYDGCEHGGHFETYDDAIASIRPTEEGD